MRAACRQLTTRIAKDLKTWAAAQSKAAKQIQAAINAAAARNKKKQPVKQPAACPLVLLSCAAGNPSPRDGSGSATAPGWIFTNLGGGSGGKVGGKKQNPPQQLPDCGWNQFIGWASCAIFNLNNGQQPGRGANLLLPAPGDECVVLLPGSALARKCLEIVAASQGNSKKGGQGGNNGSSNGGAAPGLPRLPKLSKERIGQLFRDGVLVDTSELKGDEPATAERLKDSAEYDGGELYGLKDTNGPDYMDSYGRLYDAVGGPTGWRSPKLDMGKMLNSIKDHIYYKFGFNYSVLDMTDASSGQIDQVFSALDTWEADPKLAPQNQLIILGSSY